MFVNSFLFDKALGKLYTIVRKRGGHMENIIKSGISIQKIKDKADLKSDNHSHAYYEIVYVRSGDFAYFIEDTMVPATDKSIILVDKNTIHKANLSTHNYVYFIVKFSAEFIDGTFTQELHEIFKKKKFVLPASEYVFFDMLFLLFLTLQSYKKIFDILACYSVD